MAGKIIDGRQAAKEYKKGLSLRIQALEDKGITPKLTAIILGDSPPSLAYIKNQSKAFVNLMLELEVLERPNELTQAELLTLVETLNQDPKVHGIIVQLPLPKHIDPLKVVAAIDPDKDVDCFHHQNLGAIILGDYRYLPCTAAGIDYLIRSTGVSLEGKHCVIVGRSNIVGKPIALIMLHANATVTICHSYTKDLAAISSTGDILIGAVGKTGFITKDMVKKGAIVIDVGINYDENGVLHGDVDFHEVRQVAGYITPVPGGVGPMTVTMLMENTVKSAEYAEELLFR